MLTLQPKTLMNNGQQILDLGYDIDSAASYRNEKGAGDAICEVADIPLPDIFFTLKARLITYDDCKAQTENTLAETGLKYVDLMHLHCHCGTSEGRKGAWKALVEARETGKVKSIGVSNYGIHHLDQLEQHIRKPETERGERGKGGKINVAQYEPHPWCARKEIVEWCRARDITVKAYSPLVRGKRWGRTQLVKIADKYGKSEAQILLRWSLQKGFIPLPKSVTPDRIWDNTDIYDFELSEAEMMSLETNAYAPVCWYPTVAPFKSSPK